LSAQSGKIDFASSICAEAIREIRDRHNLFQINASLRAMRKLGCPDPLVSMPTAERPKPMHIRRTILCLAAIFFWAVHDPDVASGQSSEFMEAYNSYNSLYQQGRYSEAELYAKEALRLGTEEFGRLCQTNANQVEFVIPGFRWTAQNTYDFQQPLGD
jgi:hypothetical protein